MLLLFSHELAKIEFVITAQALITLEWKNTIGEQQQNNTPKYVQ